MITSHQGVNQIQLTRDHLHFLKSMKKKHKSALRRAHAQTLSAKGYNPWVHGLMDVLERLPLL